MSEIISTAAIAAAPFSAAATVFLSKIAGVAGGEVAELIADPIRERRAARTARVLERASELAPDPQPVPDRILAPILQHASLEDDELIAELWAQLLASAAKGHRVHPAYAAMLAELSPLEASIIEHLLDLESITDALDRRGAGEQLGILPSFYVAFTDIPKLVPDTLDRLAALDNLQRINLLMLDSERVEASMNKYSSEFTLSRRARHALTRERQYAVTSFGLGFLDAIAGARRPEDVGQDRTGG